MTTSKSCANCVLSIKTDKRYSARPAAYSGASAAPSVGLLRFCASFSGVYCRFLRLGQLCWSVAGSKIAHPSPISLTAFSLLIFGLLLILIIKG